MSAAWSPEVPLILAANQVGVRETGHNRGPQVEQYLRAAGLGPGHPWCAAFVTWALVRSGVRRDALPDRAAAVREWARWAEAQDRVSDTPARGRLFYWLRADGLGHIGFVRQVMPTGIGTIEGNTDEGGGREGDGVYRRVRAMTRLQAFPRHGFIDLEGLR